MSNLNLNQWQISRRQMLRGMGASISLPLLDCMASLPAPTKPKRSVFLYIPNGVNTLTWQIEKAGKDFQFTKTLESLEKHRADVTPISGLHHPMVLGKHHNCDKVWLTGADVPGDGGAFRNSVSADQMMAEVQGTSTRYSSFEMAIEGHSLAWSRDGIQIPAERNTQTIFNMLFELPVIGVAFVDDVGNGNNVPPEQIAATALNVGVMFGLTVIVNVAVVAH